MSGHGKPEAPAPDPAGKPPSALKLAIAAGLKRFIGGVKGLPALLRDTTKETVQGVRSPDGPTRRTSWSFLFFLLVSLGLVVQGGRLYIRHWKAKRVEAARILVVAEEKRAAEETEKKRLEPPPYVSLGIFTLELRSVPGRPKPRNSLNTAEMEIVVTCSEAEVCEWLKENTPLARAELGSLFVPTERDRLLTTAGKRAFREEIREALNHYLEKKKKSGTILEVLFPRFIIG